MATARAIATGNWSATSTWNGGVLPGNGDTVYSNNFTVTIDQNVDIGNTNNPVVSATTIVSGGYYQIESLGSTNWTSIGSSAAAVGTIFLATSNGSGTGTARSLATLTNLANTPAGASAGGGFTVAGSFTLNADLLAGASGLVDFTGSAATLNITTSRIIAGSTTATSWGLRNNSTGAINITGASLTGTNSMAALNNSSGQITINSSSSITNPSNQRSAVANNSTGSITINSSNLVPTGPGYAVENLSTGTITLSLCNCIGGSNPAAANSAAGTINASLCNFNGGSGGSFGTGLNNFSASGSVVCTSCTFTASNIAPAITSANTSGGNRFSGTFISSANGTQPINATRWILNSSPTVSYIQHALDGINANSFVRFFTADNALGQANPTDVRSGVSYASGNLAGRLTVPARGSVALSVNYGPSMPFTATVSGTTATATLAYSYPLVVGDQITVTGASNTEWNGSYNIATVVSGTSVTFVVPATHSATAGTGALMQTTGTAVLDPAAVASAVWGAASRTLTSASGPTAADNATAVWQAATRTLTAGAGITAADVWSHASRTITGGTVTTLTNAPSVPSAAAIASQVRTELSVELGRVDQAISTRATPGDIPTESEIAAEVWAKPTTELTITGSIGERAKNQSTVSTTGAQLAAALS